MNENLLKVISGLAACTSPNDKCDKCPYRDVVLCIDALELDALDILQKLHEEDGDG